MAPTKAKEAQLFVGKVLYALLIVDKIKHASIIKLSLHLVQAAYNLSVISNCLILNVECLLETLSAQAENTMVFTRNCKTALISPPRKRGFVLGYCGWGSM